MQNEIVFDTFAIEHNLGVPKQSKVSLIEVLLRVELQESEVGRD